MQPSVFGGSIIKPTDENKFLRWLPALEDEIGDKPARLLLQLDYWIRIGKNLVDGKWWTYQSIRDIQEKAFKGWGVATINRTIKQLEALELIEISNYNKVKYDRTRWFAINPVGIGRLKSIALDQIGTDTAQDGTRSDQIGTASNQNGTTIPLITTENSSKNSTEIQTTTPAPDVVVVSTHMTDPEIISPLKPNAAITAPKVTTAPNEPNDIQEHDPQPASPAHPVPAHPPTPPLDWQGDDCAEVPEDLRKFFNLSRPGWLEMFIAEHGLKAIYSEIARVRDTTTANNPPGMVITNLQRASAERWSWPVDTYKPNAITAHDDWMAKFNTSKYRDFIES